MAISEERLRRDLEHVGPPGDPSGVVERVLARVARRRKLRRVQATGLVCAVVAGSIAGTYGLSKVFLPKARLPAVMRTVEPSRGETAISSVPTSLMLAAGPIPVCDVSSVRGDFFGDGVPDAAYVFDVSAVLDTCLGSVQPVTMIGVQPDAHGEISITHGPIDCPGGCRAFAAADIDGDSRAEIGVVAGEDGSTQMLTLYRIVDAPSGGGGPVIEQIHIAGADRAATLEVDQSDGTFALGATSSCAPRPALDPRVASASDDVASIGSLSERYRDWLGRGNHGSGVKAGQDPALLSRIAAAAAEQGLGGRAIRSIFRPSFSWGLNDPNGAGGLLRFLLRSPDLLARVVRFEAAFRADSSNPYFQVNPGAEYQSAVLQQYPELHAAYSVMAEGERPFSEFWETEGNLLPLATIAGRPGELGRTATDVLTSLQRGLEQFPDRNYFFVGGEYSGPRSVVSLRPDLAAFVRSWDASQRAQSEGSCDPSM